MTIIRILLLAICALGAWELAFPQSALAYIDPGSGSYILQMLIGGLLAAAFSIKIFWHRILFYFSRLFGRKSADK